MFQPLALGLQPLTLGPMNSSGISFPNELGQRLTDVSEDARETISASFTGGQALHIGSLQRSIHSSYRIGLAAHHLDKFAKFIPTGPKVISQNALNFWSIFEFSLLKNRWGTPVPDLMYVSKPSPYYITCKKLGGGSTP